MNKISNNIFRKIKNTFGNFVETNKLWIKTAITISPFLFLQWDFNPPKDFDLSKDTIIQTNITQKAKEYVDLAEKAYYEAENYKEAAFYDELAAQEYAKIPGDDFLCLAAKHYNYAWYYYNEKNLDKLAITMYTNGLGCLNRINVETKKNQKERENIYENLSIVYNKKWAYDKARESLIQARGISESIDSHTQRKEAAYLNDFGNIESSAWDHEKARKYFKKSYDIKTDNYLIFLNSLWDILDKIIEFINSLDDKIDENTQNQISELYNLLQNILNLWNFINDDNEEYQKFKNTAEEIIKLIWEAKEKQIVPSEDANVFVYNLNVFEWQSEIDKMIVLVKDFLKDGKDKEWSIAVTTNNLGNTLNQKAKILILDEQEADIILNKALEYLKTSITIKKENWLQQAECLVNLWHNQLLIWDTDQAEIYYLEAYKEAGLENNIDQREAASFHLSAIYPIYKELYYNATQERDQNTAKNAAQMTEDAREQLQTNNENSNLREAQHQKDIIILIISWVLLIFLMWAITIIYSRKKLKDKNMRLKHTQEEIIYKNKMIIQQQNNIMASIVYAKKIQDAYLPSTETMYKFFPQNALIYKPRDIVSGDFYFLKETDKQIIFAVADCTWHGVPGAFLSVMEINFMNEAIKDLQKTKKWWILDPSEILEYINTKTIKTLSDDKQKVQINNGMDVSLITISKENGGIQFSWAKNPLYVVEDETLKEYKWIKKSIGDIVNKTVEEMKFTSETISADIWDIIWMFSDGFQDQFWWHQNKKFMKGKLKDLLLSIRENPIKEQKEIIETNLKNRMAPTWSEYSQTDDITVFWRKVENK